MTHDPAHGPYRCTYCHQRCERVLNKGARRLLWCGVCACRRDFTRAQPAQGVDLATTREGDTAVSVRWTEEDINAGSAPWSSPASRSRAPWRAGSPPYATSRSTTASMITTRSIAAKACQAFPIARLRQSGAGHCCGELKTDVGQVTPAQAAWLEALGGVRGSWRNVAPQIWPASSRPSGVSPAPRCGVLLRRHARFQEALLCGREGWVDGPQGDFPLLPLEQREVGDVHGHRVDGAAHGGAAGNGHGHTGVLSGWAQVSRRVSWRPGAPRLPSP